MGFRFSPCKPCCDEDCGAATISSHSVDFTTYFLQDVGSCFLLSGAGCSPEVLGRSTINSVTIDFGTGGTGLFYQLVGQITFVSQGGSTYVYDLGAKNLAGFFPPCGNNGNLANNRITLTYDSNFPTKSVRCRFSLNIGTVVTYGELKSALQASTGVGCSCSDLRWGAYNPIPQNNQQAMQQVLAMPSADDMNVQLSESVTYEGCFNQDTSHGTFVPTSYNAFFFVTARCPKFPYTGGCGLHIPSNCCTENQGNGWSVAVNCQATSRKNIAGLADTDEGGIPPQVVTGTLNVTPNSDDICCQ